MSNSHESVTLLNKNVGSHFKGRKAIHVLIKPFSLEFILQIRFKREKKSYMNETDHYSTIHKKGSNVTTTMSNVRYLKLLNNRGNTHNTVLNRKSAHTSTTFETRM